LHQGTRADPEERERADGRAPERLSEARALFVRVGKQLGQRAIYLEVREGGEIIDLE
jgi:hypothetical protein